MGKKGLIDRHRRFVDEYFACGMNASAAYRKVYPKCKDVNVAGPRLLATVGVRAAVDARLIEEQKKLHMTADEVLREASLMARGRAVQAVDDQWAPRKPSELPEEIQAAITGFTVHETISEDAEGKRQVLHRRVSFRTDKAGAVRNMLQRHGLLKEHVELGGNLTVTVSINGVKKSVPGA